MCVSQPCALVWMTCYFMLKYFPMFLFLVECFMLSALNVRMLYLFAYHGHDNLSHWQFCQLFCLSMSLCIITILLLLSFCAPLYWLEVCLGLHYLQFVFIYWNFFHWILLTFILCGTVVWFFAVGLFYCRCLVDLPGVKTLLLTNQQHQLLKGLDYHLRHLKTPMSIGSDFKRFWQVNYYSGTGGRV